MGGTDQALFRLAGAGVVQPHTWLWESIHGLCFPALAIAVSKVVGTVSMVMTKRERREISVSVLQSSPCLRTAWKSSSFLAFSRISVDDVAPGTWLGYLRSAESDLWEGGRGKASTKPCQAMHCHSLFLKPQKTPHPFYSLLFPHQPCVRCSWAMDLGKPSHLHLMGKQQQSPWEQGSPAWPHPAGEDG